YITILSAKCIKCTNSEFFPIAVVVCFGFQFSVQFHYFDTESFGCSSKQSRIIYGFLGIRISASLHYSFNINCKL
ncbi:hypothetical protein Avbf_09779, partial [Armadillidium vulgare]